MAVNGTFQKITSNGTKIFNKTSTYDKTGAKYVYTTYVLPEVHYLRKIGLNSLTSWIDNGKRIWCADGSGININGIENIKNFINNPKVCMKKWGNWFGEIFKDFNVR